MSDPAERMREIRDQIDAGYDGRRTENALGALHVGLRRRRARRLVLGSSLGALAILVAAVAVLRARPASRTAGLDAAGAKPLFTLPDGSLVMPLDPTSRLVAKGVSPKLVALELLAGAARFEVAPNREREFRVSAGSVEVVVVGTKFSVERRGERTAVVVQSGRVRVVWERGEQLLDAGEKGSFPPFEAAGAAAGVPTLDDPASAGAEPNPPAVEPRPSSPRAGADWRVLAKRGEFPAAYRALHDLPRSMPRANVDELLLAADVARRNGHALESVPYLEKALALREGDARAAVVAFTLGRVRQVELHDYDGAAAAFAKARATAPQGPLAEDSLAREIEVRFLGGDEPRAHALAKEYLATWPAGSHLRAVRHFGGLP